MPARPLIQARALLRYTKPSGGASKARVPVLAPPTAALHCRGYRVSSKLLASSSSSSSSSSSTSASNSTPDSGASQGWSSGTVLAVAAAAAVSGWGISSLVSGQGQNGPQSKTKSKNKSKKAKDDDDDDDSDGNGSEKRKHDGILQVANDDEEIGFANRTEMKEVSC